MFWEPTVPPANLMGPRYVPKQMTQQFGQNLASPYFLAYPQVPSGARGRGGVKDSRKFNRPKKGW